MLSFGSVAVAVMFNPMVTAEAGEKLNVATPLPWIGTFVKPRNVSPWLVPAGFEKNSTRKIVFGVLVRVPVMVVVEPDVVALVRTGAA